MKKRFGLLIVSLCLTGLLAACGQTAPVTTESGMQSVVNSYESYLNAGDVKGAAALFDTPSYVSVVNRIDTVKGVIDSNTWNVYTDVEGWLEDITKVDYHLTLSDCQLVSVRIVCQTKITVNGHIVEGTQEMAVQGSKITAISIFNNSIE